MPRLHPKNQAEANRITPGMPWVVITIYHRAVGNDFRHRLTHQLSLPPDGSGNVGLELSAPSRPTTRLRNSRDGRARGPDRMRPGFATRSSFSGSSSLAPILLRFAMGSTGKGAKRAPECASATDPDLFEAARMMKSA
jgi:hypothetical protein